MDSHVATVKYHMHYPIFMACTGAAVIFLTSYPYTVRTRVNCQAVSPMNGLGTRLALSQLYMQYATVVSYPGCLIEKQLSNFREFKLYPNAMSQMLHCNHTSHEYWIIYCTWMFESSHVTLQYASIFLQPASLVTNFY